MNHELVSVVALTLKVATVACLASVVPCFVLAYLLARHEFVGKSVIATLVGMPLVLPPTVVGVILLHLFATDGPLGPRRLGFDLGLVLDWKGAALASAVMSLPLLVRTARVAFEAVDPRLEQMARTLGYGPFTTFLRFTVPIARRGLLAAFVLGFTRALGEYGATVTLAGSIPGLTRTLASAITNADQSGADAEAKMLAAIALGLGFVAVYASERLAGSMVSKERA